MLQEEPLMHNENDFRAILGPQYTIWQSLLQRSFNILKIAKFGNFTHL